VQTSSIPPRIHNAHFAATRLIPSFPTPRRRVDRLHTTLHTSTDAMVDEAAVRYGWPRTDLLALIGKPYAADPHLPLPASERGPLEWRWLPFKCKITLHALLLVLGLVPLTSGSALLVAGFSKGQGAPLVGGLVLQLIGCGAVMSSYMLWWNAAIRAAMSVARGRAAQARSLWSLCTKPWVAKDTFYIVKVSRGMSLRVLRDGTTEMLTDGAASVLKVNVVTSDDANRSIAVQVGEKSSHLTGPPGGGLLPRVPSTVPASPSAPLTV